MLGKSWGAIGLSVLLALAGCDSSAGSSDHPSDKDGGAGPSTGKHDSSSPPAEMMDGVVQIDPDNAGNVMGIVSGISGDHLEGAVVQLGGKSVMTGPDGVFELGELNAEVGAPIVVSLDGYASGRTKLEVVKGADNYVKITLAQAETAMLEDAQEGGVMKLSSGVQLELPKNAIVDKEGNAVEGAVQVQIALLNDRDEIAAAPGNMLAQDDRSGGVESLGETPLESFGMAEVTLLDMKGNEVNLNGKAEATLNIPMAANHAFKAGDLIPLWHYDESANVWKHEGDGTLQDDNSFKISVPHFSWWNADQIMTKTCVIGRVLDASGKPVPAAQLDGEGRSYMGNSHAVTGAGGDFCMEARVGSVIDVSTTVQVDGKSQALAVRVNTPRTTGSCGEPTNCLMIDDLVAIADQPLCDPAKCPQQPGKVACCTTDLGPCDYIVNGDCGGNPDGSWDPAPETAGVEAIPGVPMSLPPDQMMPPDAGTDAGMTDTNTTDPDPGTDPTETQDAGTDAGDNTALDSGTGEGDAGMDASVIDPGDASVTGGDAGNDASVIDGDAGNDASVDDAGSGSDSGPGDASVDAAVPDGGNDADGGHTGGGGVDRCSDVTALADISMPVQGTTVGSSLLNDWYDEGGCNEYLPGFERVYSVDVPAGATLRARAAGQGGTVFYTVIALDCSDVVGSCTSAKPTASYFNSAQTSVTVFVIVDAKNVDAQSAFTLYLSTAAPSCGDHFVDNHEACDDGNLGDLDGCSGQCAIEEGYSCSQIAGACRQVVCGDGHQEGYDDYVGAFEMCDDDNNADGDGCSATCYIEQGYVCDDPGHACRQIVCGDGIIDGYQGGGGVSAPSLKISDEVIIAPSEHCDDQNTDDDDGCSSTCQIEPNYACTGAPSVCVLRPQGDLCSNPLPLATGNYDLTTFSDDYFMGQGPDIFFSTSLPVGQLLRIKGTSSFDGYVRLSRALYCPQQFTIERRIFANVPFDVVFERQQVEEIGGSGMTVWFTADVPAVVQPLTISSVALTSPVCGDGVLSKQLNETCDDGNAVSEDGCDSSCHTEPGYACPPGMSCHHIVCNDGITDWPFEDCEDGNTVSNDGCSATCHTEPGYLCDWPQMLCETRGAGDLCNNADAIDTPFFQNELSMAGMTPDSLDCSGCDATRWFSFSQQPGDVSVINVDASFSGFINLFGTACPASDNATSQQLSDVGFGTQQQGHLELWNDGPTARTVWMRISRNGGASDTFLLRMKTGPLGCGDGILNRYGDSYGSNLPQPRETCDDMNKTGSDGCSSSCQVEPGYRCPQYGGACEPIVCGDGVIDQPANGSYEACDDGNKIDGDGCTSCQLDPGAICVGNPSTCTPTVPGDVCETALPLPLGDSGHVIDPFTSDPYDPYHNVWSGQSAWFVTTLAPREVLSVSATATFSGYVQLQSSGVAGCANRITHDYSSFGGQTQFLTNDSQQPMTAYVVVIADTMSGLSGNFTLTANKSIPTLDCSSGTCVSVICGDGSQQGSEQCDDGNTFSNDGCSSNCVAETSTHVCTGSPSVCTPIQPGDACENALPMIDGTYDFSRYVPEPSCNAVCGGASRWFTITVPAWHSLWYHLSTGDDSLYGMVRPFDVSTSCWEGEWHGSAIGNDPFFFNHDAKRPYVNASPIPVQVAIVVWSEQSSTSATFTLEHSLNPIGCGDGLIDYNAQFGAYEGCDDGNKATGDGCDASCQPEPGWDCRTGTCVPVVCGDSIINGNEGCDDGNAKPDDGCSDSCTVEPGWLCGGEPYACYRVSNGDMCSNAQPLVDGDYDLTGFLPDLPCQDVCQGPDRWLTIDVPAGQTLLAKVSSEQQGSMRFFDITQDGCHNLSGNGSGGYFGGNLPGDVSFVNWSASPRTIAVAVSDPYNNPSSFAFNISHQLKPIGCGDGYVDFGGGYGPQEQCDDGNQKDDDGCSSTCTIDPGWLCGNNSPSRCVLPPPGDMCQTAQPLMSGDYDLGGYMNECVVLCMPDRWLITDLAPGDLLVVNMTTTSSLAHARLYDLTNATCSSPQDLNNFYFSYYGAAQMVWYASSSMKVALDLADANSNPSNAKFTLDVRQGMPHCGDSFHDTNGQYGPPEQCDDGNNFDGDGCSSTCQFE